MYCCKILEQECGTDYKKKNNDFVEEWKEETKEDFISRVQEFLNYEVNRSGCKLIDIQWLYDSEAITPFKCIITYLKELD